MLSLARLAWKSYIAWRSILALASCAEIEPLLAIAYFFLWGMGDPPSDESQQFLPPIWCLPQGSETSGRNRFRWEKLNTSKLEEGYFLQFVPEETRKKEEEENKTKQNWKKVEETEGITCIQNYMQTKFGKKFPDS